MRRVYMYQQLGFEPYSHWEVRTNAFDRQQWEDGIITNMASRPPVTSSESRVDHPEAPINKQRRKRLTNEVVKRRVLAGHLLEEADELESTLDELGGPLGSAADIIHKTRALSTRQVDKQTRKYLLGVGDKPVIGGIQAMLALAQLIFSMPETVFIAALVSTATIVMMVLAIVTH